MRRALKLAVFLSLAIFIFGCEDYTLKAFADPGVVSAGGSGKLVVSFKAHGKYHLEPEGLVLITFEPPAGVAIEKTELKGSDKISVGKFESKFTVAPGAAKGMTSIPAKVMFQLCTKEICRLINEERRIPLTIK